MSHSTILHINSSGRKTDSVTRVVSEYLSRELLCQHPELNLHRRDLATGLPFIDEQWISANFTPYEERKADHHRVLSFSDLLVAELQQAEQLVIAAPVYNLSIPAVLKAWIDLVVRARLTFHFTENGPSGLLNDRPAYLVMASGGLAIGSEQDYASTYLTHALGFVGIHNVTLIDCSTLDISEPSQLTHQLKEILATNEVKS
ncbi:FMN-dependent NADH-azoreductase [Aliikangiella maris]|uniref:FMN dependent NADH:quinone oxidoreductase n=2 Tax=Aliikangiella maris TaxID=3162458 RepID=A0ABV3MLQ0_9GAMM